MNCCRQEQVSTKEHVKMLKQIQIYEGGRFLPKRQQIGKVEGFMAQKGLWNLARNKALQEKGALPREEGDTIREYTAMHEEKFLSSCLREDGRVRQKEKRKWTMKSERTQVKMGKRVREKEEDETVVKRNCANTVSVEAFDIFSQRENSECDSCGANSDCESGTWSSALVGDDIYVPLLFWWRWWVMVTCPMLVGSSGRSVALSLCRMCLWFLMRVRLLLLLRL